MTISAPTIRNVLKRALIGLAFAVLLALVHLRWNLGILFLVGLCLGSVIFSLGLPPSRFPVALAIWLGQYSVFWLRVISPVRPRDEMVGIMYIINGIAIFMPAVAVFTGTYIAIVLERNRRVAASTRT